MISVILSLKYIICTICHCCKFCHIELYLYIGLYSSITLYIQRRLYLLNYSIFTRTNLPPPEFSKFLAKKLIVRGKIVVGWQTDKRTSGQIRKILLSDNAFCLSLLSLVGFEEILRFTQDDSLRVSLVAIVAILTSSLLAPNDASDHRRIHLFSPSEVHLWL